jgi:hypothetical protein
MPEDVINGRYKGVMANHEVERFRIWDNKGDEMIVSVYILEENITS